MQAVIGFVAKCGKRFKFLILLLKLFYKNQSGFRRFLINCGFSIPLALLALKWFKQMKRAIEQRKLAVIKHKPQAEKTQTPALNAQFFKEFKFLLKIMFPKLFSKQVGLLTLHTLTLVCRTFLTIYVAKLEGLLVRHIVQKQFYEFARNLLKWLLIALPATSCNSLIKYLEAQLDLEIKSELVKKSLKRYFANRVYYKIALKQSENIQVDQNLSEDIEKLTSLFVHLYSQLTKPILDISLITATLISLAKHNDFNYMAPTALGIGVITLTGLLLRLISPRFGKLAAEVAKHKGYLRFLYSRIQANSEEIAFYAGERVESGLINQSYLRLKHQLELVYKNKLWYVAIEQFLMKYVWSAAGLSMISIPILLRSKRNPALNGSESGKSADQQEIAEISERTEQFTMTKNLLSSAADAIERILTSYKEVIELTGYTRRVYDMFALFNAVDNYENSPSLLLEGPKGEVFESPEQKSIVIDRVGIVTPNGEIIVPSISITIEQGMNVLITGPNGCGKSSLFRIINSLWPLHNGTIHRPKINEMFYVPQRPYLAIGTLREQIIYPDDVSEMRRKKITDEHLMNILDIVNLQQVVIREGGLDSVADWKDVLSGGEKQKLGLSRIFYHKPMFAFLDECTSAISIDVEGKIYLTAKNEYKITLLTIAHRATLWQYHDYILQFDGHGSWKFEELNSNLDQRLNLKQEKDSLEKVLLGASNSKERLRELCEILGEDSVALSA